MNPKYRILDEKELIFPTDLIKLRHETMEQAIEDNHPADITDCVVELTDMCQWIRKVSNE